MQEKTAPAPTDVAGLVEALNRAHRLEEDVDVSAFIADLRLETLDDPESTVSVDVQTRFLAHAGERRTNYLIRYAVEENGERMERGRGSGDPDSGGWGYWAIIDGRPQGLTAARHRQDREKIQKEIRLARQLLQCLDPGAVLQGLRETGPVQQEELKQGRRPPVACLTVEGQADAFPLYDQEGEAGRAFLKLWVRAPDGDSPGGELVAVQVTPMTETGGRDPDRVEFVRLTGYVQGTEEPVLLPGELTIFRVDDKGLRNPRIRIGLRTIDLRPELVPADFNPR